MPPSSLSCLYGNDTPRLQIIRLVHGDDCLLERTLLPGQRLSFSAPPVAQLQVHTSRIAVAILEDTIPCLQLQQPQPWPALVQVA